MVTFPVVKSVEESMSMLKREMKVQKDPNETSWGHRRSETREEMVGELEDIVESGWYETKEKDRKKQKQRTTVDCGKITGDLKYECLLS